MAELETVAEMLERVGLLGRSTGGANGWVVAEVEAHIDYREQRARIAGRREALADLARWFREDAAQRADPTSIPLAVVLRRLGVEP